MSKESKFNIREIFNISNLVVFIISIVLGVIIFVIYSAIFNFSLLKMCDGMFVAAAILLFFGLGHLIINQGTLDVIPVGFSNLYNVFKRDGKKKYDGLYEYQQVKAQKRKDTRFRFIPIVLAGLILLIVSFILLSVFNSTI